MPRGTEDFPTAPPLPVSNPPVTDAELVERARAGDPAAFGALVDRYQHVVFRAALAVVGRREEAEDVAQEALVRAYRGIEGFRGDASVKTWLLAITWRQAHSHRRALAMRLRRFVGGTDAMELARSGERPADAVVADAEFRRHVARATAALPRKYREALLLSATGDHTFEEMSAALGVPAGTLKWRVSEARRLLKAKLAGLGRVKLRVTSDE